MRYPIATLVGVGLALSLALPASAAGLTQDQINSVVSLLQSFNVNANTITTVQAVLNGQTPPHMGGGDQGENENQSGSSWQNGSSTAPMTGNPWGMPPGQVGKMLCVSLNRNLGPGSQGNDVRKLQDLLKSNGLFSASSTGVFGPMTIQAMARFQRENGIASTSTGIVGPATRGFFNRACGNGLGGGNGQGQNQNQSLTGNVTGPISAINNGNIIVWGQTARVVFFNSSTTIQVYAGSTTPRTGTQADLAVGEVANVEGTLNQDNTITAILIKLGMPPSGNH